MKEKSKHMHGFYGIRITPAVCILPECHPCYGCVWYDRNTDVFFCPFHNCVRNKKGFMPMKKTNYKKSSPKIKIIYKFGKTKKWYSKTDIQRMPKKKQQLMLIRRLVHFTGNFKVVQNTHKLFSSVGNCNIIVLTLRTFFLKKSSKSRFPIANIFSSID